MGGWVGGRTRFSVRWDIPLFPKVTVTSAWVSPRVKRTEPWGMGRTPSSMEMGRTGEWVGGWVGGWMGWLEEEKAVGTSTWMEKWWV